MRWTPERILALLDERDQLRQHLQATEERARDIGQMMYRRGYEAGYKTGRRSAPACPDGSRTGRPRAVVA